mmetsp:Transcript_12605/g.29433  ORF Transcript_12605/g.29433 Transcript_12605/m.29433 type:complete len:158 (-) Transcript_12605:428-901(-)
MTCTNEGCKRQFCFVHNDAHPDRTCKDYTRILRTQEKPSEHWKQRNAKKCPGCKTPIEKNEGCNHMSCTCGTDFCWLCGKRTDDYEAHFAIWNVLGCPASQQGYQSTRYFAKFVFLLALPLFLVFLVLGLPVALCMNRQEFCEDIRDTLEVYMLHPC